MNYRVEGYLLRKPEQKDLPALYEQKNDPDIAAALGGFSTGYSMTDLQEWLEYHRKKQDEVLWAVVDEQGERCVGHVGLYQINHRVRSAEFAIMLGDRSVWGKGLGTLVTRFIVDYGFRELALNRISLSVLATNERAWRLYRTVGFREEGRLRQAQIKGGSYVDLVLMSILREEYETYGRR